MIGAALDFVEVHYGFGRHQNCLTAHELLEFQKYTYGEWIQTFATLMWTKVSICLFLLRIAINKKLTRPLQWGVVALIVSNIILTLCWILQCRPVRAAWDTTIESQCFSRGQKQRVILAQASGTPSKTNIRHECTNSFHSHFSDLRFYLRECSHTAIVERADQVEKKNWLELSNGVRCNVLTARPNILALLIK